MSSLRAFLVRRLAAAYAIASLIGCTPVGTRADGCPFVGPGGGSACTATDGLSCEYGSTRCRCNGGYWYCEPIECPVERPVNRTACPRVGLTCAPFFEGQCDCVGPEMVWNCCGGASCGTIPVESEICCQGCFGINAGQWHDGGGSITATCGSDEHWRGVTFTPGDADTGVVDATTD